MTERKRGRGIWREEKEHRNEVGRRNKYFAASGLCVMKRWNDGDEQWTKAKTNETIFPPFPAFHSMCYSNAGCAGCHWHRRQLHSIYQQQQQWLNEWRHLDEAVCRSQSSLLWHCRYHRHSSFSWIQYDIVSNMIIEKLRYTSILPRSLRFTFIYEE